MFTVIYTFRVKPELEQQFKESWTFITKEYLRTRGSLGSRLYKDEDGSYVGIAQWPDKATWAARGPEASEALQSARTKMGETCSTINTTHQLELIEDHWSGSR